MGVGGGVRSVITDDLGSGFPQFVVWLGQCFLTPVARRVDTGHWQAMQGVPQTKTIELLDVYLTYEVPETVDQLQVEVNPNLPWAEAHFRERVGGEPLNPGETYKKWPWYKGNVESHKGPGTFSHTYMERYWPRYTGREGWVESEAGPNYERLSNMGIRYRYGDLNDLVDLLAREPYTRQAVLPVWFPEDTGAHHGERVPCSLTYHFMLRDGRLHCWYDIRSCDFLRHFRDDVYLTCRLVQWVIQAVLDHEEEHNSETFEQVGHEFVGVKPGVMTMGMHSLHIFEGDLPKMEKEYALPPTY